MQKKKAKKKQILGEPARVLQLGPVNWPDVKQILRPAQVPAGPRLTKITGKAEVLSPGPRNRLEAKEFAGIGPGHFSGK